MRNLIIGLSIILIVLLFSSCSPYDDYFGDYQYSTAYFAYDKIDRSVIIDEYDYIQVGAVLGGKISNTRDETVHYEMADELVLDAGFDVLPAEYYEFENNEHDGVSNVITISKGEFLGMMKVNLLPSFFNDEKSLDGEYALGFRIIDASTDSIGNAETIITFRYLSNAIGNYTHSGRAISSEDTLTYNNEDVELTTALPVGSNSVLSDKVDVGNFELSFHLLANSDNSVTLTGGENSDYEINELYPGFFDRENDHNIYLHYSFEEDGKMYEAHDTLYFVKRTVDNIIQWDTRFF